MERTGPRYTISEAILAAPGASLLYALGFEMLDLQRVRVDGVLAKFWLVLPIAVLGMPTVGVLLARALKRRGWDGPVQVVTAGAFIGMIVLVIMLVGVLLLFNEREISLDWLGSFSHFLANSFPFIFGYGASGGAVAALTFIVIARLRAR